MRMVAEHPVAALLEKRAFTAGDGCRSGRCSRITGAFEPPAFKYTILARTQFVYIAENAASRSPPGSDKKKLRNAVTVYDRLNVRGQRI